MLSSMFLLLFVVFFIVELNVEPLEKLACVAAVASILGAGFRSICGIWIPVACLEPDSSRCAMLNFWNDNISRACIVCILLAVSRMLFISLRSSA